MAFFDFFIHIKNCRAKEGEVHITYTAIKIKLYPTEKQKELIDINFSCCGKVWNTLLAELTERNENGKLDYSWSIQQCQEN